MCGIAALFSSYLSEEISRSIVPMGEIIRHRGPDDEGYAFFGKSISVCGGAETPTDIYEASYSYTPKQQGLYIPQNCVAAFGHRRLSILDLSAAGHQPMCTPDKRLWITYNGEVYNYIEIRHELELLGHSFMTKTDTEIILHAYEQWGSNCLSKFNGMFAFVIYDSKEKIIFAARDRFGVKPLYIWKSPQGVLAFASEIKQFTVLPGWSAQLNGQSAYDYLNWGVKNHNVETFFSGVIQLLGGEYLETNLDSLEIRPQQWYFLRSTPFQGTFADAADRFLELFQDAVRLRLRADVRVGSCLSGGLDSSSIVCVANQMLRERGAEENQMTFTACSDVKRFDERPFADLVVQQTGVRSHYTYPSLKNLLEVCTELVWHQDEPFGSTSMYAQWAVFELVKKHNVKVILDGQGSDEQLGGYHGFFGNRFYDLLLQGRLSELVKDMYISRKMHPTLNPIALLGNKLVPDLIRQPIRRVFGKISTRPDFYDWGRLNAVSQDPFKHESNKSMLQQSKQQLLRSSVPMLLHWEDRNSMAHSVESRTPFLDYRLVEFNLGLPGKYKIGNGWTKRVLREGMKGILPEEVRLRIDKKGFVTAEEEWVRNQNPQLFRQAIAETIERSQGVLKPSLMLEMNKIISGNKAFDFSLWRIVCFGKWMDCFNVKL